MNSVEINLLSKALQSYREAVSRMHGAEAIEDSSRLALIADGIIAAIHTNDINKLKLSILGFSRQVSDSFSTQPPEFRLLADSVAEIRRRLHLQD
jgi:hypothetical protein